MLCLSVSDFRDDGTCYVPYGAFGLDNFTILLFILLCLSDFRDDGTGYVAYRYSVAYLR